MAYDKRHDGRALDEPREMELKVGVIKNAKGSAYFRIGKTAAYAAVYGPRDLHPKFLQDPAKGKLRCYYNMMPFSGQGDRVRPGANRRAKEISFVTGNALNSVIDLKEYPTAVVDVFIELPQTDAGSRCAGICAASMALADAGFKMTDMPVAIAVGMVEDTVLVDLDYKEEAWEGGAVDIAACYLPNSGKITLLQMDGVISKDNLRAALEMGKGAAKKIYGLMATALKQKYEGTK